MAFVGRFALALLCPLIMFNFVQGDPDTTLVTITCNGDVYGSADLYTNSVSYVLGDTATSTSYYPYFDYYTYSPDSEAPAYGHGVCSPAITFTDHATCGSSTTIGWDTKITISQNVEDISSTFGQALSLFFFL